MPECYGICDDHGARLTRSACWCSPSALLCRRSGQQQCSQVLRLMNVVNDSSRSSSIHKKQPWIPMRQLQQHPQGYLDSPSDDGLSSYPVWPHQLHRLRHACLLHNGLDLFRILHLWRHAHVPQPDVPLKKARWQLHGKPAWACAGTSDSLEPEIWAVDLPRPSTQLKQQAAPRLAL